ncbi:PREDICTED: zinc finger protein 891 [Chinchilla lanigera]|uniref:zinc finger protein 891 n=1 Tax=Chinchilla lanigera TaxID=34839 RepID=UPI000698AE7D|nr:PREDICTED: zinc finger protein 891 [Chinchilla lanigera]XP_013359035.1 PREDICTED: zinc finger protein 891 [Chinchilla lanigera]
MAVIDLSSTSTLPIQDFTCFCMRKTEEERVVAGLLTTWLQEPVTIKDITLEFTLEEWMMLDSAKRNLYKDVMVENYRNLTAMEYQLCELSVNSFLDQEGIRTMKRIPHTVCPNWMIEFKTDKSIPTHNISREKASNGVKIQFLMNSSSSTLREDWECQKIRIQHKILERHFRQVTHMQKKTAFQENFCDYHELQENSKLRPKIMFSQRVSTSKHWHKCNSDIQYLKHNSVLSSYEENCMNEKACESHEFDHSLWHLARILATQKQYTCSQYGMHFKYSSMFPIHNSLHVVGSSCEYIKNKKPFCHHSSLKQQEQIHTKDKDYECSQCAKAFKRISNFILHKKSHMGAKQHDCKECGKVFNASSTLRRRERTHTGEKPYECNQCGKSFGTSSYLIVHKRTHTGEKLYGCSDCGKAFNTSSHLKAHRKIHTGENLFECSDCGRAFSGFSSLRMHIRTHTGERPYECMECRKAFHVSSSLKRRENSHWRETL